MGLACALQLGPACVADTALRRTALVPAHHPPSRTGAPMSAGQVRATGALTHASQSPAGQPDGFAQAFASSFAKEGDPGLLIPDTVWSGQLHLAPFDALEVGAFFRYAHVSMAAANVVGVLPHPDRDASLLEWGPSLRLNLRFEDSPVSLGFLAEMSFVNIQQATFVCEIGPCVEAEAFDLEDTGIHKRLLPSAAFIISGAVLDELSLSLFVAGQGHVRNIGFEPDLEKRDESSLSEYEVLLVGVEAEAFLDEFVLGFALTKAAHGERRIPAPLSATFKFGVLLDGREDSISSGGLPGNATPQPPVTVRTTSTAIHMVDFTDQLYNH